MSPAPGTAHHGLKDHQLLRHDFTLLMEPSGKQVSINKLAKILRLSPDTSRRYLGYFENYVFEAPDAPSTYREDVGTRGPLVAEEYSCAISH